MLVVHQSARRNGLLEIDCVPVGQTCGGRGALLNIRELSSANQPPLTLAH